MYVLTMRDDYDRWPVGVYSTRELAEFEGQKLQDELKKEDPSGDYEYEVSYFMLDNQPKWGEE